MNGPLRITGPFNLTDQEDQEFTIPEGQAVALCRCGRSENKPFCDSSHRTQEPMFEATSTAV
jgi:CDGSH-type Zn-finger protein